MAPLTQQKMWAAYDLYVSFPAPYIDGVVMSYFLIIYFNYLFIYA